MCKDSSRTNTPSEAARKLSTIPFIILEIVKTLNNYLCGPSNNFLQTATSMEVILLLLLAGIVKFGRADHVVVLGNMSPPATVGPNIPIFPFKPDPRGLDETVNMVPSGFLTGEAITLNPMCIHMRVGQGWGTVNSWSHGYVGDVYYTAGARSLSIGLPSSTSAFVFYIMANYFYIEFEFTVAFSGGQSVTETLLTSDLDGDYAVGFAVFMHDEFGPPTGVSITNNGDANGDYTYIADFAIGEFYIGIDNPPVALCKPSITVEAVADCTAHDVNIDDGSYDPDGNGFTLIQVPSAPYPIGDTLVTLTVDEDNGPLEASCTTIVTVTNDAPVITPIGESTVLVGGSVPLSVTASDPESQILIFSWDTGDCPGAAIVDDDTATPTLSIAAGTSPGHCQVSIEVCDACGSGSKCSSATGQVSPMILHYISHLSLRHILFLMAFMCSLALTSTILDCHR